MKILNKSLPATKHNSYTRVPKFSVASAETLECSTLTWYRALWAK